jgi:hypothetical protein
LPVSSQFVTGTVLAFPEQRLNNTHSKTVDQLALAGATVNNAGVDSSVWLLEPLVSDYVTPIRRNPAAAEVRMLDDVLDAETELVDEELLELLAGS